MSSVSQKQSAADVAAGFSITGLLDASAKTRERFPVREIPIEDIADHPGNVAYSMDAAGIEGLASSILKNGLTDLPLVRKMDDGSWQMISGHRRKAAYTLLAREDTRFEKIPCRIIEDISDKQAETLLHTANYFVRQLSVTERAAATRALGTEARIMLTHDPAFKGKKADDAKAAIITATTGKPISAKTIRRTERMARQIEHKLVPSWATEANAGHLSETAVDMLASMEHKDQEDIFAQCSGRTLTKQQLTELIRSAHTEATNTPAAVDARLARALLALESYDKKVKTPRKTDIEMLSSIRRLSARLLKNCK